MIEFLAEYGLFLAKAITIVVTILITAAGIVSLVMRQKANHDKQFEITHLNNQYDEMEKTLSSATLSEGSLKLKMKADKKQIKARLKAEKKAHKAQKIVEEDEKKRLFILDFQGDMQASTVSSLREEVSAVLTVASSADEVLVRLESSGGTVHGYGLGASQLQRIRDKDIPLTVAVDKVAASGGYMMACVGNSIISAPFAILGSIGVLAQLPNLHRLLEKNDIDFEQLYAGEYKRTLTLFGKNTEKGRTRMQEDLEDTHSLFKEYVKSRRPELDIDKVATGEHWLGTRALELGLVDKLQTSDDYLMSMRNDAHLIKIEYQKKQNLMEKISHLVAQKFYQQQTALQEVEKPLLM